MISVKYALIIVAAFAAGSFFTPPVQQAIAAVIATDVQCTGCVGASDLAGSAVTTTKLASNSVNGGKISDGTISAADLGPDSVGASELKGVSKILFAQCPLTDFQKNALVTPGATQPLNCSIAGVDGDDAVLAILNGGSSCFDIAQAFPYPDAVNVYVRNECSSTISVGSGNGVSVIVFDK